MRAPPFWLGDALGVGPRGLELDGLSLADIALAHGTPLYVYGSKTVRRRFCELRGALAEAGIRARILYAMKANRSDGLLALARAEGDVGIDACSPREVERALERGFSPEEISVTAGMLSNRDLAAFARMGVHLNLDTRSALRRYAATPGALRRVGLRVDPEIRVGWGASAKLAYGDSKFGFASADVLGAAGYAASLGLEVDTLHVHAGWGLQASAAPLLRELYGRLAGLAQALPSVRTLDIGGGLCPRHSPEDHPLSVSAWADLVGDVLGASTATVACEPGTFIAASAGVLLAEVNTVEPRPSGLWIGIDAGHNVNVYAAHYGIPLAIIPVARPLALPTREAHVAGNINEANDVFARSLPLPVLEEGDLVALYPAGAYGASMASNHCLRGLPAEVLVG